MSGKTEKSSDNAGARPSPAPIQDEPLYAHSLPGEPREKWETLDRHLIAVASRGRAFGDAFNAANWVEVLGLWHDLGKRSAEFQSYIKHTCDADASENESVAGRVDHSTYGARHAVRAIPGLAGQLLAFCIAGHHGRLPDATAVEEEVRRSTLDSRLSESSRPIPKVDLSVDFPQPPALVFPFAASRPTNDELGFAVAFFTRMLFSALIDADRTATEAFCNKAQSQLRLQARPGLGDLRLKFDAFLEQTQSRAPASPVNHIRAQVLRSCLSKAALSPGFFAMNVPTGGGKTFSSLAFALHHAYQHPQSGFRRVIVAIPFTSIIEQTAEQYRAAFDPISDLVLVEHHSNLRPERDTRENKLATENWDAPLIVTTNVQLFESLFAAHATPCRKLHRVAKSIIILDEAQTIPVDLMAPTLAALRELVARYGCTVVLCTATQPALEHRPGEFEIGLRDVRPIIDDAPNLHTMLKRVDTHRLGILSDDDLAKRLAGERAVLCVVNSRPHTANVFEKLKVLCGSDEGCFHLSTFMCAQHRRDVLAIIRNRLKKKLPCRLVSTQLIEAGVDIDFPVVYRAPAGFDSIAQAAGRCNREGLLQGDDGQPRLGEVFVFETESPPPPGFLRQTAQTARELFDQHPDPLAPSAVEAYFRLFYWSRKPFWDRRGVLPQFGYPRGPGLPPFMFRQAAEAYQMIPDQQTAVLVPYTPRGRALRDALLRGDQIHYSFFRESQRYVVSLRDRDLHKLQESGAIVPHESGLWAWANDDGYDPDLGVRVETVGLGTEWQVQ